MMDGPSILIYHPVFPRFLSHSSKSLDGVHIPVDIPELIQTSRRYFKLERQRMSAMEGYLRTLLPGFISGQEITIDEEDHIRPDGAVAVNTPKSLPRQPYCVFLETKNESGTGTCDPTLQCQSDFLKVYSSNHVSALQSPSRRVADRNSGSRSGINHAVPPFSLGFSVRKFRSLVLCLRTESPPRS